MFIGVTKVFTLVSAVLYPLEQSSEESEEVLPTTVAGVRQEALEELKLLVEKYGKKNFDLDDLDLDDFDDLDLSDREDEEDEDEDGE